MNQITSARCLILLSLVFTIATTSLALTPTTRVNGKIAFASDRHGDWEIYVMNADGTGQQRLTNRKGYDDHPTWSPDGRSIAYTGQTPSGQFAIFQMNSDGSNDTEVTFINGAVFANTMSVNWSPDGRMLVFSELGGNIVLVNVDGTNRRVISNIGGDFPAFSPDGNRIIYRNRRSDLSVNSFYTVRLDGTDLARFPTPGFIDRISWQPRWSHNGDKLTFSFLDWDINGHIGIMNDDGTSFRDLGGGCSSGLACSTRQSPSFSPDDKKILFGSSWADLPAKIATIDLESGIYFEFSTPASSVNPSWQPVITTPSFRNGRIAFTSDRDGNFDIYSMNADGTDQIRLTNGPGVDDHPKWSPDGRKIAYVCQRPSSEFYICIMNADGSSRVEVLPIAFDSTPYPWHSKWSLDWSPDGKRIVFPEDGDIHIIDIASGHRTNLTNSPDFFDGEPAWSPDGARIIFVSSRVYYLTLHTIKPDGTDLQAWPTSYPWDWDMTPSWSPTGDRVVFVRHSDDLYLPRIFIAKPDGTDQRLFDYCPSGPDVCSTHRNKPVWSPDGSQIVFHTWEYFSNRANVFVKNIGTGAVSLLTYAGNNFNPSWQPAGTRQAGSVIADFDGDGKTDISIFRPSAGEWWYARSSDNDVSALQFGTSNDRLVTGDFTGDGKADPAFFRPSNGHWFILRSDNHSYFSFPFGAAGDIPMPADYDADGRTDAAVFRPSEGVWYILRSSDGGTSIVSFGTNGDLPVAADYDGDGRADIGIVRDDPSNGSKQWWIQRSSLGIMIVSFGAPGDKAVPGDFTGDGRADVAFFRPSNGAWYVLRSDDLSYYSFPWGLAGDIPAAGDYDGDGIFDAAVFRPSTSTWFVNRTGGAGPMIMRFGLSSDEPVPSCYVR